MTYSNSDVRVRRSVSKPLPPAKTTETKPVLRRRGRHSSRRAALAASVALLALLAPLRATEPVSTTLQASAPSASPGSPGVSPLTAAFIGLGGGVALCSLLSSLLRDPLS